MVNIKQKLKEIIVNYKDNKPFDIVINQMLSLYFDVEEESKDTQIEIPKTIFSVSQKSNHSKNTILNEVKKYQYNKEDNIPITGAFLENCGFTSKYGNNYYEILIKKRYYFSIAQIIQEDGFVENTVGFRDANDNDEIIIDYTELKTEKQLINLIQTLFGITLTKKQ